MDCKEAVELITASLDGELEQVKDNELEFHLSACVHCRNEIELERITKNFLRQRLSQAKTPPHVAALITQQAAEDWRTSRPHAASPWRRMLTLPFQKTIMALGGAIIVFTLLFILLPSESRHIHVVPNDGNILHQTYSSFDGIINGSIVPQISSDDPSAVKAYFTQKVNFNVSVPQLRSCRLLGGIFSNYNNQNVAQVIYKNGDDVVYLYEARFDSVMRGSALHLPQEAKDELQRSGWYVENHTPNCTLIVWKGDPTTICCAVAEMNKDRLLACLQDAR